MNRTISLNLKFITTLFPKPPFNFDATVYVPHHFPEPDFEWKKGVCWQTMNFCGKPFGIKMENERTINKPKIKLSIYSNRKLTKEEIEGIVNEINFRYGLNEDISEFCNKFKSDKFLKLPIKRLKGMRINCANSLYELFIIAIVLQNATVRRSVQMMNNLFNAYGWKLKFDNKELFAFWRPEDLANVTEEELRALRVGYRAKMIKRISESFAKGEINEFKLRRMTTEEARNELIKLYGVGPATAQIILSEYSRRYDVFDLKGKLWEQKILSRVLFNKRLVSIEKIVNFFEKRYGKWKGLAFHYIFTDLFWRHKEKKIEWLEKEIRI
jgi:3-methyladenine DNA glycosylase/8-oxoguanine DNA glycosylase